MLAARSLALVLALAVLAAAFPPPAARVKRQLADDDALQPLEVSRLVFSGILSCNLLYMMRNERVSTSSTLNTIYLI